MKKNNHILVALLGVIVAILSCSKNDRTYTIYENELELIDSYSINVSEPSGLAISKSGNELFTVSDNTNKIYKLSLAGKTLNEYSFIGNDLEGVSSFTNNKLLLAEERTKEVIEFDLTTESYTKHTIDYENKEENSGIEGVCYNVNSNTIYVLNEQNPGLLIELDSSFSIVKETDLDFASDYSGIFYDTSLSLLWIVSDQSKTLNKCKLNGELIEEYKIDVNKAEGVVVTSSKVYIVSDSDSELYVFEKPIK